MPQPRLVSQPGSQPAQSSAVAKLELMNELLSFHYLQEGGNIWGEGVRSFFFFFFLKQEGNWLFLSVFKGLDCDSALSAFYW